MPIGIYSFYKLYVPFYICRSKAKIANYRYLRKQTEAVKDKDY